MIKTTLLKSSYSKLEQFTAPLLLKIQILNGLKVCISLFKVTHTKVYINIFCMIQTKCNVFPKIIKYFPNKIYTYVQFLRICMFVCL